MTRWVIAVLLCLSYACSRGEPPIDRAAPPPQLARARGSIDVLLRGHAEVDRLLDAQDPRGALRVLEDMRALPPPPALSPEEKRVIAQDLAARLAETHLALGDAAAALAAAEHELAEPDRADVFTANLHVAAGRALEALGRSGEAAERYHRALRINEALLEKELNE